MVSIYIYIAYIYIYIYADSSARYCRKRGELRRVVSLSRLQRHRSDDISVTSPGFVRVASSLEVGV